MVDSYEFGIIVVDGRSYTSDVIIYPNRVDDEWWREDSHRLYPTDIDGVVRETPEVIVVGTGQLGVLEVPASTRQWIEEKGIELKVEPTQAACRSYNRLSKCQRVIAALHVTC